MPHPGGGRDASPRKGTGDESSGLRGDPERWPGFRAGSRLRCRATGPWETPVQPQFPHLNAGARTVPVF